MPPRKFWIWYIAAAAFWDVLRHVLKETILYFAAFAKLKKMFLFKAMQTLHNKIKSKIFIYLFRIYLLHIGLCTFVRSDSI